MFRKQAFKNLLQGLIRRTNSWRARARGWASGKVLKKCLKSFLKYLVVELVEIRDRARTKIRTYDIVVIYIKILLLLVETGLKAGLANSSLPMVKGFQ